MTFHSLITVVNRIYYYITIFNVTLSVSLNVSISVIILISQKLAVPTVWHLAIMLLRSVSQLSDVCYTAIFTLSLLALANISHHKHT